MAWNPFVAFVKSGKATGGLALLSTGGYITYTDQVRLRKMAKRFSHGCLLPDAADSDFQSFYMRRPKLEETVRQMLSPEFSGQFYFVKGEVGTGKSRTFAEIAKEMINSSGKSGLGAPIYVLASHGKSFPDTLARAVGFNFDEHINFKYFLDIMFRINSMPEKDAHHKLSRVLNAIEEAAALYVKKHNHPVVLIIDSVDWIVQRLPGGLERIQEKAKLWADANLVKVIFISNEEEVEKVFERNHSNWARADTPLVIHDLSHEEAVHFLQSDVVFCHESAHTDVEPMSREQAHRIIRLVGGRIQDLILFKRDYFHATPFRQTKAHLKLKERGKFVDASRHPKAITGLEKLLNAKKRKLTLTEFISICGPEEVDYLLRKNLVRLDRSSAFEVVIAFESKLTEHVVSEFINKIESDP